MSVAAWSDFEVGEELTDDNARLEEEWLALRSGRITCSNFGKLIGTGRKGEPFTETGYTYLRLKVAERFGSWHSFKAASTDWGHDIESKAIDLYRERTGFTVKAEPFQFIQLGDHIGGTPDGLVNCDADSGCLEVKCPWNPAVHINTLLTGKIPREYQWQVVGHLLVSRRQWCDFVSFDPRIDGPQQMVVVREERNEEHLQFLAQRLNEAVTWVNDTVERLTERTI